MNNIQIINSTFSFDWIVKSIPYSICYRKAFSLTEIDGTFCTILHENGGSIDKVEFGELLGFNLIDMPEEGKYRDIAEESIYDVYLK